MSSAFANAMLDPKVQCIKKDDVGACIEALSSNVADVFTTDGGYIYQNMQQLKPIMAEDYGFGEHLSINSSNLHTRTRIDQAAW